VLRPAVTGAFRTLGLHNPIGLNLDEPFGIDEAFTSTKVLAGLTAAKDSP